MPSAANHAVVADLTPQPVWTYFAQIASVPRASKREAQIQAYARATAERLGFSVRQDRAGNIVIDVPASPGCEKAPITVLQGHLDMVCEKNAGIDHDFDRDPIRFVLDEDAAGEPILRADGTTLGADNGIGVAMALAVASSPDVRHGPLEILCTSDEEMGMTGAKALEPDFLRGRRMINLDSEEDDAIYIGCAGGLDSTLTFELATHPPPKGARAFRVDVAGLRGGHSGGNIHENRGNAIKLLARVLGEVPDAGIAAIAGGSKRNAIPREAHAVVVGGREIQAALESAARDVQNETHAHGNEPGCAIRVEACEAHACASPEDSRRLVAALAALPHGVLAMVPAIPDLVQTSNSTSTVETAHTADGLRVTIGCLSRSSLRADLHAVGRQIAAVARLAGANVTAGNEYPGWRPNKDSPLLAICTRVYERLFGQPPHVTAIHAGLECGLIGERMGEGTMDMVSMGPHIAGAHSPDECVYVRSVEKSYRLLTTVLAELAKG